MNRCFGRWELKMTVTHLPASRLWWFRFFRMLFLFEFSRPVFLRSRILCRWCMQLFTVYVRILSSLSVCFSALFLKGVVAVLCAEKKLGEFPLILFDRSSSFICFGSGCFMMWIRVFSGFHFIVNCFPVSFHFLVFIWIHVFMIWIYL